MPDADPENTRLHVVDDRVHVAPQEARSAVDGGDYLSPVTEGTWRPTRKWLAQAAGAGASVAASWLVSGAFDDVERGMIATALVALAASYFAPNQPTPGGVPERSGS